MERNQLKMEVIIHEFTVFHTEVQVELAEVI